MNPELQKELATWLASMRGAIEKGADFALEQAPLVVQEKILYGRITSTVMVALCLLTMASFAYFLHRVITCATEKEPDAVGVAGAVCCGLMLFVQLVVADWTFVTFFKSWFAPRLYVMEWLASLIK